MEVEGLRERFAAMPRGERLGVVLLLVVLVAAASLWYVRSLPATVAIEAIATVAPPPDPVVASPSPIVVHVTGRVAEPGVYQLSAGARLVDAVAAAGGSLPGADLDALNLAAPAVDGTQVHVPKRGEVPAASAAGPVVGAGAIDPSGRVNVNTASVAELDTLPGIGPALAQRIIDFRTANGPFASVDDLDAVSGIGPATLEELRPLVTV